MNVKDLFQVSHLTLILIVPYLCPFQIAWNVEHVCRGPLQKDAFNQENLVSLVSKFQFKQFSHESRDFILMQSEVFVENRRVQNNGMKFFPVNHKNSATEKEV